MVHAMTAVQELIDSGYEVKILFEGIGVTWIDAFHRADHPFTQNYGPKFEAIKPHILGACNFCTTVRFEVGDSVNAVGIDLLGEDGGHFSVGNLVVEGYQIINY